jgi:ABC-type cobalamin/Fe3+-siderophores transport system ATPase subunit
MSFNLSFPCANTEVGKLQLNPGEMLYVLGSNGAGKSSLMHKFAAQNHGKVRKISAHRQTWMSSDALDMTPANKVQMEKHIQSDDVQQHARYKDQYAAQRASMTVYDLIDAENVRARAIAADVTAGRMDEAAKKAKEVAPIAAINELLRLSNIPIEISVHANERVLASKEGGPQYSAAELSDGERNALLIAGSLLTAPPDTLIIVDEPERHLHRSIIAPLLSQLFERRQDCAFVVSTHDHNLPLENPLARTLLVRSCSFNGQSVNNWEADELTAGGQIDEILLRDLLGARRKILFVEGTENSLDKPLYSLIFPRVSVIAKGNCRDVELAVQGVKSGEQFHWLRAFGIVDSDGFDEASVSAKASRGVYAVPYYSVEAIYFHPRVIELLAVRQAAVSGDDAGKLFTHAIEVAVTAVGKDANRLCGNAVKKAGDKALLEQLPSGDDLLKTVRADFSWDGEAFLAEKVAALSAALEARNWEAVIQTIPIRECEARGEITRAVNFRSIAEYQKAVRHLLISDADALEFVRSLFVDLHRKLVE